MKGAEWDLQTVPPPMPSSACWTPQKGQEESRCWIIHVYADEQFNVHHAESISMMEKWYVQEKHTAHQKLHLKVSLHPKGLSLSPPPTAWIKKCGKEWRQTRQQVLIQLATVAWKIAPRHRGLNVMELLFVRPLRLPPLCWGTIFPGGEPGASFGDGLLRRFYLEVCRLCLRHWRLSSQHRSTI